MILSILCPKNLAPPTYDVQNRKNTFVIYRLLQNIASGFYHKRNPCVPIQLFGYGESLVAMERAKTIGVINQTLTDISYLVLFPIIDNN